MENFELTYGIVEDMQGKWSVHIENGKFKDFYFKIDHLRLTYKDENDKLTLVKDYSEVEDKEVQLDFQYDLMKVPADFENNDGDQYEFEEVARNILIDILMNHKDLYKLEQDEHQTNSEQFDQK